MRLVAGWPVVDIVVLSLQKSELLLDESTVLLLVPVVLKKRSCVISQFHILFFSPGNVSSPNIVGQGNNIALVDWIRATFKGAYKNTLLPYLRIIVGSVYIFCLVRVPCWEWSHKY